MSSQPTSNEAATQAPKRTLARRLSTVIMLLAMTVFIVSMSTAFQHSQNLIHKEVMSRSASVLNTTLQRVTNYMSTIETAAKSNVWLLDAHFNPDSLQSISRHIVQLNKSVLSCSVSTEPDVFPEVGHSFSVYSVNEGDTIITVREQDFEYFHKKWYRNAVQTGNPCWVDPFSDFSDGKINIEDAVGSYCIPLRPNGRHVEGVVSVDFSFNRLAETILNAENPYHMLLGEGGRYLIHPDATLLFKTTIFSETDSLSQPDVAELAHEMTSGKKGIMHVNMDGINSHVCYAPIPGTHWSLALVCLESEIMAEHNNLAYFIVAIIILGLLLIWWLTQSVVRQNIKPVNQLLDITKKIAEGNYEETIPISTRKDAIANLQNSFAAMQQSIVSHIEAINTTASEIKQQNAELEQAALIATEASKNKSTFVRGILRQIRTPLNIIEGLTNVLCKNIVAMRNGEKSLQEKELTSIAGTLKYNAYYLNRMMLMLRDISETETSENTRYHHADVVLCNEVAQECISYALNFFPNVEIHYETEVLDSAHLHTSHIHLMRSIRELLYNAAKFSDGKHIVMRVTQTPEAFHFIVEDRGPGLPLHTLDVISQPFAKVEEHTDGLGLGLPLAKRHVTALGGQLIYDNTYRDGCRFIIEIPKAH